MGVITLPLLTSYRQDAFPVGVFVCLAAAAYSLPVVEVTITDTEDKVEMKEAAAPAEVMNIAAEGEEVPAEEVTLKNSERADKKKKQRQRQRQKQNERRKEERKEERMKNRKNNKDNNKNKNKNNNKNNNNKSKNKRKSNNQKKKQ